MDEINPGSLTIPEDERQLSPHEMRRATGVTANDLRQRTRMPDRAAGEVDSFDPRLAYELALEMAPAEDVFRKYGMDADGAMRLTAFAPFQQKVKQYREEIVAGGISFKLKAKIQAEDLLSHSYDLATDAETPPSVRADLIKWTAAVAGLGPDPSKKGEGGANSGAEFRLNITFAGAAPQGAPAIDVTPTSKEVS